MSREYLDFKISIGSLADDSYPVSVYGPGGDAQAMLILPTQMPAYQRAVAHLAALDTHEVDLVQLGQLLFDALFISKIRDVYMRSQGGLKDGQGLRLIFEIDAAETVVAALPWEFLNDPDQGPLAMLHTSMVRYIQLQTSIPTLAAPLPLKVLLTGADISSPGQVARELDEIQQALEALGTHVSITVESHLTRSILQRRLRDNYHVWHFVGQGALEADGQTGFLQFEHAERVSALELSILLKRCGVRLVVLNACQSAALQLDPLRSIAPALVRADVPAVIAMQLSMTGAGARAFASEFYTALAEGHQIDACVTEGRKAVMGVVGLGRPDWGLPVVYTRAPDGRLFAPPAPTSPRASAESQVINDGFLWLRAFIETPEVRDAVNRSSALIEEVLRQIGKLNHYKKLHDQLQQLEDCVRIVDGDRRQLSQNQRGWGALARSEEDLYEKINLVLELVGNISAATLWIDKLQSGQHDARKAVAQDDLNLLDTALNQINNVLDKMPSRINAGLVVVAEILSLDKLAEKLTEVSTLLSTLDLGIRTKEQYRAFVQGIAALEQLDVRKGQLVSQHNLFQELDDDLRQLEVGLDLNRSALAMMWPDLQRLHMKIYDDHAATWVPALVAKTAELGQSLAALSNQHTTMIFWRYRGQVSQSFNKVDTDLLKLCEELQGIGRSLEFVLRTVQ